MREEYREKKKEEQGGEGGASKEGVGRGLFLPSPCGSDVGGISSMNPPKSPGRRHRVGRSLEAWGRWKHFHAF